MGARTTDTEPLALEALAQSMCHDAFNPLASRMRRRARRRMRDPRGTGDGDWSCGGAEDVKEEAEAEADDEIDCSVPFQGHADEEGETAAGKGSAPIRVTGGRRSAAAALSFSWSCACRMLPPRPRPPGPTPSPEAEAGLASHIDSTAVATDGGVDAEADGEYRAEAAYTAAGRYTPASGPEQSALSAGEGWLGTGTGTGSGTPKGKAPGM